MLQDIFGQIQAISCKIREDGSTAIWYRGHQRSEWELKSTLHRYIERLTSELADPLSSEERRELLREEAKSLYRRFKVDAWPMLKTVERSDWGILFTMQHYRLPTRLLDWTESFACALYFAQQHRKAGEAAAIWVLDGERLNETSVGRRGLIALDETVEESTFNARPWHPKWLPPPEDLPTIAVAPIFTNPRMTAQRSVFTLTGDGFSPLEDHFEGRLVREGILRKLELPPEGFDEVEEYLSVNGLGAFTYFPDLEGLAIDHEARLVATLRDTRRFFPGLIRREPGEPRATTRSSRPLARIRSPRLVNVSVRRDDGAQAGDDKRHTT